MGKPISTSRFDAATAPPLELSKKLAVKVEVPPEQIGERDAV